MCCFAKRFELLCFCCLIVALFCYHNFSAVLADELEIQIHRLSRVKVNGAKVSVGSIQGGIRWDIAARSGDIQVDNFTLA